MDVYPGACHHFLPLARRPSPFVDLLVMIRLWMILRRQRIQILHTVTPKAALLGAVAGFLAGVPIRIHTFTGQVWARKAGPYRVILKAIDRWVIRLNKKCYADSQSQVNFLVQQGVARLGQVSVVGDGSLSGFDPDRFNPAKFQGLRQSLRSGLGFTDKDFLVNFTGRLTVDKGVLDLARAILRPDVPDAIKLVLVGPPDGAQVFNDQLNQLIVDSRGRIVRVGYQSDPAPHFSICDIFAIPSYREGFGGVVIEAAMMGLPAVASSIPGLVDAVDGGHTGILVEPGNCDEIADAILKFFSDRELLQKMSLTSKSRALRLFHFRRVNVILGEEYLELYREFLLSRK